MIPGRSPASDTRHARHSIRPRLDLLRAAHGPPSRAESAARALSTPATCTLADRRRLHPTQPRDARTTPTPPEASLPLQTCADQRDSQIAARISPPPPGHARAAAPRALAPAERPRHPRPRRAQRCAAGSGPAGSAPAGAEAAPAGAEAAPARPSEPDEPARQIRPSAVLGDAPPPPSLEPDRASPAGSSGIGEPSPNLPKLVIGTP
nr:predicted GPI-anchored protein 58 [Aegilops tauschii subsp. strangulata]